jgi:serine/threonine-protein kinase
LAGDDATTRTSLMRTFRDELQDALGGAFVIESELARGGMSHVFVAEEVALRRRIVVKVLDPDLAASVNVERFKREVALTARLQHPHIVPIFSTGEAHGLPFYTMPMVGGDSLRTRLDRDGALPVHEAVSILRDIALALECAHAHNVVHRDIKPDNVLIAGRSAIVSDFGVAKAVSDSSKAGSRHSVTQGGARSSRNVSGEITTLTSLGMTLGTPAYMAPEQGAADPAIDFRADLYSLGVVAYEMLVGRTPFGNRSAMALIAANIMEEPTPIDSLRQGIPPALTTLVMHCLEKDPAKRIQSATELLNRLATVGAAMGGSDAIVRAVAEDDTRSVAVLAFRNLSGSAENEYLSDGITEEILNVLARVPELRVAARSSSFAFKGRDVDIKEIARQLGVRSVLEGSVRQSGTRLRVTAQLSNATNGFQMWSERYDRELSDVFAIQEEIAASIAASLKVALFDASGEHLVTPARRPSTDVEAYELYLKGRHSLNHRVDGVWKAMDFYRRALDRDPRFALAHAGVAEGYVLLTLHSAVPPHEGAPKARAAAERALALEPNLPEALIVLSNASLWYDWDREETIRLIERALHLKPSDPQAHTCYAYYLASLGRHDEAVERARYAMELDPLSIVARSNVAIINYLAGRFADAIATSEGIAEMSAQSVDAFRWRAMSQFQLGLREEAFASIQEAVRVSRRHHWPLANQAAMLARLRRPDEARAILAELEARSATESIPPLALALVHYALGELDAFFTLLDKSIEARDVWLIMLGVEPGFAAVREHPRFRAALARIVPRS